jgi:hypothetical protein
MNYKIYIVVILIVILAILQFSTPEIKVASKENFASDNNITLKLYYTNWCGWSKKFLPIWDELTKKVKNINMTKIDCEKNKDMCDGVPGFPYLVLEKKQDDKITYKGDRTVDGLLGFLEKHS